MLRRALLTIVAALTMIVGHAIPATAQPDQSTCVPSTDAPTQTTATICVDVTGSTRRVYVRGTSLFTPTVLTVNWAELWEDNTLVVYNCCGWSGYSDYYGGGWTVRPGHWYQACASVGVRDAVLGGHTYGPICSNWRYS
ncbi:MAG TPA: hypothetical protein VFQ85_19465 [Mycobacteriales bacterium]|jgi:hypothetical protein|nr:hypothetical protein [Mycobacteriales bacterium]